MTAVHVQSRKRKNNPLKNISDVRMAFLSTKRKRKRQSLGWRMICPPQIKLSAKKQKQKIQIPSIHQIIPRN